MRQRNSTRSGSDDGSVPPSDIGPCATPPDDDRGKVLAYVRTTVAGLLEAHGTRKGDGADRGPNDQNYTALLDGMRSLLGVVNSALGGAASGTPLALGVSAVTAIRHSVPLSAAEVHRLADVFTGALNKSLVANLGASARQLIARDQRKFVRALLETGATEEEILRCIEEETPRAIARGPGSTPRSLGYFIPCLKEA